MSKIKTNYIEPRVSDSTVTIGTKDGHVRIIGQSVEIDGHPNGIQIGNLLEGYESLYIYITKDEFRNNSNKFFISDVEPSDEPGLKYPAKPGDAWLNNELKDWRVYSIKGNVGAWRSPQIQEDVYKLREDVIALQGEIESIIKTDEKGVWSPSVNDPPQSGEVQFSSDSFTAPSMIVKVSKTDKDGLAHLFTTANVGEWMEFIEDDADYMLGQIRELDNEDDEFFQATLDVSVGQGDVQYELGSTMKIRLFEAVDDFDPDSIRIADISASPPVEPNNGDLWFDNNSSDMKLRVFHKDSEAWIETGGIF